ncbi:hypothetical protein VTL71DRAFT_4831 [Oculimacula yallundae]|uniref:Uncharacterized protein n=1 Tax=Oculimacula yallundae TaxID=86028 RepID=A0ABR4C486_9HELO
MLRGAGYTAFFATEIDWNKFEEKARTTYITSTVPSIASHLKTLILPAATSDTKSRDNVTMIELDSSTGFAEELKETDRQYVDSLPVGKLLVIGGQGGLSELQAP